MTERYFFAEQDRQVRDCIRLEGFDLVNGSRRVMDMRERDTVNETTFLYIKKGPEETVLDFYQSPAVMVSAVVRQVFSMYEDGITFKKVYLVDLERGLSHNFYIPFIPRLEKLVCMLVKDSKEEMEEEADLELLEERLVVYPALAMGQCQRVISGMAKKVRQNVNRAMNLLNEYDQDRLRKCCARKT